MLTSRRAAAALADVAHVYRRATFGPFPGRCEAALDRAGSAEGLVEELLAAPPLPFTPTANVAGVVTPIDIDAPGVEDIADPRDEPIRLYLFNAFRPWWVDRMSSDEAGLHEKMTWFWHGHFTASSDKVDDTTLCWRNLRTLHTHALGNFGDLAKAITVDGAMLRFLDGQGSNANHPNENYARELMELFTLGIGQYTQRDVEAVAVALAGWRIKSPEQEVEFNPDAAARKPVTILGRRGRFTSDEVVDIMLGQEACAPFIVSKLWRYFIGGRPDRELVARWATAFRRSGYELAPLMGTLLRSDAFREARNARGRTAIEWYAAATRITGDVDRDSNFDLYKVGQSPYVPHSVAGWPGDLAWLSASQAYARSALLAEFGFPVTEELVGVADLVAAVVERCALYDIGDDTRAALADLDRELRTDRAVSGPVRVANVLTAALLSPEFSRA